MKSAKSQYEVFKLGLEKVGQVKRAWFTTFNLDIHFFERYVFPLLVGKDYTQMQTPLDYEILSQSLDYENEKLKTDRVDIRVFYDFRKLEQSAQVKLTTVKLHPVNVSDLRNTGDKKKFIGGVFHPKVALLENDAGALWLMTGSANLTLSGWSRNCECVAIEPITNTVQARSIHAFFHEIVRRTNGNRFADNHPLMRKLLTGKGFANFHEDKPTEWQFLSSFQQENLLDKLAEADANSLKVWSPYFDLELSSLITSFPEDFKNIEIIPSPNREGRIGISKSHYSDLLALKHVRIMEDVNRNVDQFTHAKVWACGRALAIGSWNCTEAGLNISPKAKNNVEAGIIYQLSGSYKSYFEDSFKLKILKNPILSTQEELEADSEGILEDFFFTISLELNWTSLRIGLSNVESADLIHEKLQPDDVLILPGIGKCSPMGLVEGIDVREYSTNFLADRSYTFETKEGKILYRGYLLESGLDERPAQRFKDIDDYLSGWIKGRPEEQTFRHRLNYELVLNSSEDLEDKTRAILSTASRNTWFTAFFAFDQIAFRIRSVKKNYTTKKERQQEFIRLGRTLPGNLTELKKHLEGILELFLQEPDQFKQSPIYLWFLIEKANALFELFNQESEMEEEAISLLSNFQWENYSTLGNSMDNISGAVKKWNRFITNKLNDWEWNQ